MTKLTIGSRNVPLPIHLDLIEITKALERYWWGGAGGWKREKIEKKQRNLARALKDYPKYVHAKKPKGNHIHEVPH